MAPQFKPTSLEDVLSSMLQLELEIPTPDFTTFAHLRSSFQVPTTSEVIAIQAAIHESSKQQSVIEKLLLQLDDMSRALRARLDVYIKFQSERQGMLSTVKLLPQELLSNIFLICLPKTENVSIPIDSPPWSLARVCQRWRHVSHSTPSLWALIPPICLIDNYKPGFFELFRTMIDLSFPRTLALRIEGTNAKKFRDFVHILPRLHSLYACANRPLIEALAQQRGRLNALKSAEITITSYSSQQGRSLDFLSNVSDLTLSWFVNGEYQGLSRSIEFQWPNLTTFYGYGIPGGFLHQILSSAPLLQTVSMYGHIPSVAIIPFRAGPPSVVCHTELKRLHLDLSYQDYIRPWLLQDIRLPVLRDLFVGPDNDLPLLLSFVQHTQFSLAKLTIWALRPFAHQRSFYASCPRLEELTLFDASDVDLKSLTISTDYKPCLSLRTLVLREFQHEDDSPMNGLQEFLFSRDLVPFNPPHGTPTSQSLGCVTVRLSDVDTQSNFRRRCLKVDDISVLTIKRWKPTLKASTGDLESRLGELHQVICSETLYFLVLLEDLGIIGRIKEFACEEGTYPDGIRNAAMRAYEEWVGRVSEIRGLPRWKMSQEAYLLQKLTSA